VSLNVRYINHPTVTPIDIPGACIVVDELMFFLLYTKSYNQSTLSSRVIEAVHICVCYELQICFGCYMPTFWYIILLFVSN
jgi:hypothetical protein